MSPSTASVLDPADRAMLAALAADGRASWATVGEAAGCSPSTAQRRYTRLREAGLVKVIGTVDVVAAGFGVSVLLRVHCGASGVNDAARALSRRPEVRFVSSTTGSTDCVAEVVLDDLSHLGPLLDDLDFDERWRTETLPVLRTFTVPFAAFPRGGGDGRDDLSAMDETGVRPSEAPMSQEQRTIVEMLIEDGRVPLIEIARTLGRTEPAVRRAIERLTAGGRIRIGPLVAPAALGLGTELMVWISVAPDQVGTAARQLAEHPSVHYASVTAGRSNLVSQAFLANFAGAYEFTTDVIGALPGVRDVDVTVQMTTHKRMWTLVDDGRFVHRQADHRQPDHRQPDHRPHDQQPDDHGPDDPLT